MRRLVLLLACLLPAPALASGILVPRGESQSLGLLSHRVEASVDNGLARTRVTEVFANPSERALEAIYLFPLAKGSSVSDFAMWVNGERIAASVVERQRAVRIYDEIVRQKKDPAILEQIGDTAFRIRVFPVPPKGEQKVELEYTEALEEDCGLLSYRLRMKTPEVVSRTLKDFTFSLVWRSELPLDTVYSPTHKLEIVKQGPGLVRVGLEQSQAPLDRDVTVHARRAAGTTDLRVITHKPGGEDGHFLAILTPKASVDDSEILKKDLLFVLDTSGSMEGERIELGKAALRYGIQALRPGDRFGILAFSTAVRAFRPGLVTADAETRKAALAFVDELRAEGGTALDEAVNAALAYEGDASRAFRIVLISDGEPTVGETDPVRIAKRAVEKNARKAALFCFGVGSAIDPKLLDRLAADSGGIAKFVSAKDDLEVTVSSFEAKYRSPVVADLRIEVTGASAYDVFPKKLPDLYAGSQILVAGRFQGPAKGAVKITGSTASGTRTWAQDVDFVAADASRPLVRRAWARLKLDTLFDALWLHPENQATGEIRKEIVRLSTTEHILTPLTAMLVLENEEAFRRAGIPREGPLVDGRPSRVPADPAPADMPLERTNRIASGGTDFLLGATSHSESSDVEFIDSENANLAEEDFGDSLSPDAPFSGQGGGNDAIGVGSGSFGTGGGAGGGFRARRVGSGKAAGGKRADMAVDWSLELLAKHQNDDGSFEADGGLTTVGATGLASLAFLGAGYVHDYGRHKDVLKKSMRFLKQVQAADGSFVDGGASVPALDHALATLAFLEIFANTGSTLFRDAADQSFGALLVRQGKDGAFGDAKASVIAAWALRSVVRSGLRAPSDVSAIRDLLAGFLRAQGGVVAAAGLAPCGVDPKTLTDVVVDVDSTGELELLVAAIAAYRIDGETWQKAAASISKRPRPTTGVTANASHGLALQLHHRYDKTFVVGECK